MNNKVIVVAIAVVIAFLAGFVPEYVRAYRLENELRHSGRRAQERCFGTWSAQLAGIRYRHTPSGRVEIESKEDAKKRGQQSPDRAEALVLAFARVVPRTQTVAFSVPVTISRY